MLGSMLEQRYDDDGGAHEELVQCTKQTSLSLDI